jgi:hypothetical protein
VLAEAAGDREEGAVAVAEAAAAEEAEAAAEEAEAAAEVVEAAAEEAREAEEVEAAGGEEAAAGRDGEAALARESAVALARESAAALVREAAATSGHARGGTVANRAACLREHPMACPPPRLPAGRRRSRTRWFRVVPAAPPRSAAGPTRRLRDQVRIG